jgi:1,4-alpha-glucan branching enzyme
MSNKFYVLPKIIFFHMFQIIKLITFTTSGGAYLNFIGNEFAHPKRIEFPMSSNDYSFCLANRQWELLDKGVHKHIFNFDKDIMSLDGKERLISGGSPIVHHCDDTSMIIYFTRGPFLFVFNFNPDASYQLYSVGVDEAGEYQVTNAVCMNLFFCKYASGRHI